jgi:phosphoglycerate kinase
MKKVTVRDIDTKAKRVLMRVDFNVPLDEQTGEITDDSRIRAVLPTVGYLVEQGAKVILMSHLGRPKGKVVEGMRLKVVAKHLSRILDQPVAMAPDCVGPEVEKMADKLKAGEVLLLENLRFHAGEEAGDARFARALARLGEVYVNDAFGAAHRAHASVSGVPNYLPAAAGLLMVKEIEYLSNILENPARPFAALLGGAKISDKVGVLENIIARVDALLIGGGMAATFLRAQGREVGLSLIEVEMLETAARLVANARKRGVRVLLPTDVVVADEVSEQAKVEVVFTAKVPQGKRIVDIGPQTLSNFGQELRSCQTIFWNGPMGIFELAPFAKGTQEIARLLVSLEATSVIGGGSTAEAIYDMGLADKVSFVSTGGGASLEFLGGEKLPGVEALPEKE